ncbi:MAG: 23S rRNA (guanosine(2251)-2'-O)-methyltransferase RlmB [Pseudomonadota bacterium]
MYGRHAVEAALLNPRRTCHRLLATDEMLERLDVTARKRAPEIQRVDRADLDARLGEHVVHQGIALAVAPLPSLSLEKACAIEAPESGKDTNPSQGHITLVLDRVNDPHNLGAILRSAVAFGVRAVVVPHRQSAELGGATAKAASGALDMVPIVEVTNVARALDQLKDLGYWRAGLDGCGAQTLDQAPKFEKLALVLGAEGSGIRRLVTEKCDLLLRLPISERIESLNVSVACGIALYGLRASSSPSS